MVSLYILGALKRFGPQHGYGVGKRLEEQTGGFARIKRPTVYYHLERMEQKGWLSAAHGKEGARPEKTVYAITSAGKTEFQNRLSQTLRYEYRPVLPNDALFYFFDDLEPDRFFGALDAYMESLERAISEIDERKETLRGAPEQARKMAEVIFAHHSAHYEAELSWARRVARFL